jgi:hypothetical protein
MNTHAQVAVGRELPDEVPHLASGLRAMPSGSDATWLWAACRRSGWLAAAATAAASGAANRRRREAATPSGSAEVALRHLRHRPTSRWGS